MAWGLASRQQSAVDPSQRAMPLTVRVVQLRLELHLRRLEGVCKDNQRGPPVSAFASKLFNTTLTLAVDVLPRIQTQDSFEAKAFAQALLTVWRKVDVGEEHAASVRRVCRPHDGRLKAPSTTHSLCNRLRM